MTEWKSGTVSCTRHKMAASTAPLSDHLVDPEKCPENVDDAGAFFQTIEGKSEENSDYVDIDLSVKCRGCFAQEDEMHFLFTVFNQEMTLADILKETTFFECKEDDNLPPYLCTRCTSTLVDFFNFKIRFQETDAYIQDLISKALATQDTKPDLESTSDFFQVLENGSEQDDNDDDDEFHENANLKQPNAIKPEKYIPDIKKISGLSTHCDLCPDSFATENECETHLAKEHGHNPFAKFTAFRQLIVEHSKSVALEKRKRKHLAMEMKEKEMESMPGKFCRFCNKKFPEEEFQLHWETHKIHVCELCGFKVVKKSELNVHQSSVHSDVRNFACGHCNKTFKTKGLRKRHEYTLHINPRAFCCELCGQRFNDLATMRTHVQLKHVGSREYVCPICGLDFPLKATLNKHILRHNKNRPPAHYCQICSSGFKDKSSLRRHHLVKHTNDFVKPKCEVCGKTYCSKTKLRFHVERHHSGKPPVRRGRGRGASNYLGVTCRKPAHYDVSTSGSEEEEDDSDSDSESTEDDNDVRPVEPKVKVEY
ncbi:zinc finger and BTB domain-containing protein 41-like [Anthonomus grandis grandis]|uniref:zinc finger and BTB domain-containing protein 41-like n=1 Tax=Anthonomus grandis grandis TaxID=2921223 RepID=UPI002165644D|nr:zinc finger and BTB domain-containing protein 41-like [Anthonomus grandis grandis]